ncbi:MAG: amidohydrolase [Halieaceae bacterium]|jgi:omega-amidase|nr:amidohydrolase [Halieaceae bacterium]
MNNLSATLIQCELAWESPEDNRNQIGTVIKALTEPTDLIVLPEMFTTGFSMNAAANAEEPGGATEQWLQEIAAAKDCAVAGSIAVRDQAGVFNRMLFATPEGLQHYDKRHLFRMAGENKRYCSGSQRVIVRWRGWRINLQVCYDLRFPVFSRNCNDYDLLLYVANWPAKRSMHWRQLLIARAIENQACVIGVNRIGSDANGLSYQGDSLAVTGEGLLLEDMQDVRGTAQVSFNSTDLTNYRQRFPCHFDADSFHLD